MGTTVMWNFTIITPDGTKETRTHYSEYVKRVTRSQAVRESRAEITSNISRKKSSGEWVNAWIHEDELFVLDAK